MHPLAIPAGVLGQVWRDGRKQARLAKFLTRSDAEIVSHSEMRLPSISVASSAELMTQLDPRTEVIGVDEAQFFDPGIVEVCQRIADQGKRVIVAGLDKDFRGAPFGPIPTLMAVAEEPRVKELLGIPDNYAIAAVVPIGKPAKQVSKLTRRPVAELATRERFDGEPFGA